MTFVYKVNKTLKTITFKDMFALAAFWAKFDGKKPSNAEEAPPELVLADVIKVWLGCAVGFGGWLGCVFVAVGLEVAPMK